MKRAKLPGASELFRPTVKRTAKSEPEPEPEPIPQPTPEPKVNRGRAGKAEAGASGRVRHDEKITVYFSSEELIRLEDARLDLRRNHRLSIDRGRMVRAAVALALAELEEKGKDSALYRHLDK